jgi:hypothetical protein
MNFNHNYINLFSIIFVMQFSGKLTVVVISNEIESSWKMKNEG